MLKNGETFFKHKITRHLGSGAFGDVYLAENIISKQHQALKVIKTTQSDNIEFQVGEIRNLATCNCEYVVKLNEADIVSHNNEKYIAFALEYLKEGSLESKVKSSEINFREILTAIRHILHGLNVAHKAGIIHKDIKPANIMIDKPYFKLSDFGLSFLKSNVTNTNDLNYVLHAAPELLAGNIADERSDLYAVGMTFFRLVIPSAFFDLDQNSISKWLNGKKNKNLPSHLGFPAYLPLRIKKIINKATSVSPDKRYQTAVEMLHDLEKLQIDIAWKQSADGFNWSGLSDDDNEHVLTLHSTKKYTHCKYKVNRRKPRSWDDIKSNYEEASSAMYKLISKTMLI